MMNLPTRDDADERLVIVAKDPDDHRDWLMVLPSAAPQFIYDHDGDTMVRWSMPKEDAINFGFWGRGCACCGAGGDTTGDAYEFDTELEQVQWYLAGLS